MSAVFDSMSRSPGPDTAPLIAGPAARLLAFGARAVCASRFWAQVHAAAQALPVAPQAINLCEDRHAFLVGFCAAVLRGQVNLLPHSRAPEVVADLLARHPDAYCLGDEAAAASQPPRLHRVASGLDSEPADAAFDPPAIEATRVVALGFTSGSTGVPTANPKTWGSFAASTARNREQLQALVGGSAPLALVATVPPQHMYGMELSVLLPLLGGAAIHDGRPFFPAEIAATLAQAPVPAVLVTTPVHLRALLESGAALPPMAGIVSATAPLPQALAAAAEARSGAPVLEMFGSTETCVIGYRRTARDADWKRYPDLSLSPQPDGTLVQAPYLTGPVLLQDVVEPLGETAFRLRGRNTDLLEIAGKRASLGDLTRRLLAVPGVRDGVVFQDEVADAAGVRRICALAVAPELDASQVLAALRPQLDPVFLPRPLLLVESLPRNEVGKLPRAELMQLLRSRDQG